MPYEFICTGNPPHTSYSASKEQIDPLCPECGAPMQRLKGDAAEQSVIWFPGIYSGREGDYAQKINEVDTDEIIALVQKRAQEDGEWAIETGHVGENEDTMRKMMAWVSDETNIRQAVEHILKEGMEAKRTVDWLCHDLANASKWVGGSRD